MVAMKTWNPYLAVLAVGLISCKPESKPTAQPAPAAPPPVAAAPDPGKPDSYLGLDEKSAGEMADKAGIKWRVVEIDGQPRPATMDYRPDRLNFALKDGKVIRVTKG